ncbi:MAG: Smr/MutS family protein [Alphaproteobacteria bacterium]|nr:Smr/MutS family protein [Alphaproteobacteria bacterium]
MTDKNDDEALWKAVTDTVRPLNSKTPAKKSEHVSLRKKLTIDFQPSRHSPDFNYAVCDPLIQGDLHAMDKKTGQRFKAGAMQIDARLDLHGYTLDKAFDVLKNFIHDQSRRNARCLLVITGKGGLLGRGVLKAEMPVWMNSAEIRSLVLSYTTAQPKDGGDGAFYILLKRNRT